MKLKRLFTLFMVLVMVFTMTPNVYAAAGDTYSVTVNYLFEDGTVAANPWTASLPEGDSETYTAPVAEIMGYEYKTHEASAGVTVTKSGDELSLAIQSIAQNITVNVYYRPAEVEYTVKYFQQDVNNDDSYALVATVTQIGLTGTTLEFNESNFAVRYEGFYVLPHEEVTIAADGSTEIEVYFDRDYYLMTFNLGEGGYGVEPIFAKYGAPISVGAPTRPGYTFDGWDVTPPATMPAENTSYTAKWIAQTDTKYTVAYWYENADDTNYSYVGKSEHTSTVGTTISSADHQNTAFTNRDDAHFTYNSAMAQTVTVKGDGSTILNVYFTRNTYTITFVAPGVTCGITPHTHTDACVLTCTKTEHTHNHDECCTKSGFHIIHNQDKCPYGGDEHTHTGACYSCGSGEHTHTYRCYGNTTVKTVTRKYDADITDIWPIVDDNGVNYTGYDWESSVTGKLYAFLEKMPGQNITMTEDGNDGDLNTWYYYLEVLPGVTYTVDTRQPGDGKTYYYYLTSSASGWSSLTYEEDYFPITGFSQRDSDVPDFNNNTAYLYYLRNQHQLTFNNRGTVVKTEPAVYFGAALSQYGNPNGELYVPPYPANLEAGGYYFDGWYSTPDCVAGTKVSFTTETMPDGDLELYANWLPITHTVNVYKDNTLSESIMAAQYIAHRGFANAPGADPVNGQYTFVGWFYMDNGVEKAFDFASMPILKDLNIYAKWSSKTLVSYTVNYYLQGTTTPVADSTTGSALGGATKTFDAKGGTDLYTNYQVGYFPTTPSHSLTMSLDTANVYDFYYVEKQAVPYTVYYLKEDGSNLFAPKTVSDNRLAVVTETALTKSGYLPDAYQKTLVVSGADGAENVIIFYYTEDSQHALVVEQHYLVNGGVVTLYTESTETGTIGTTYSATALSSIDGYKFAYAKVDQGSGDQDYTAGNSLALTNAGLVFKFYYTYNRFDVYYQSLKQAITYDMVDTFNVTDRVHNGYLYGGMYEDATFTTPLNAVEGGNGLGFAPQAGKTYYVKEVPETYIQPKIYYIYDKHNSNKLVAVYIVTAVDDLNYLKVGFDDQNIIAAVSGDTVYEQVTVNSGKIDETTGKVVYDEGAVLNLKINYFFKDLSAGHIFIRRYEGSIDAGAEFTFHPFYVTPDNVKVTGVKTRTVNTGNGYYTGNNTGLHVNDTGILSSETQYTEAAAVPMMLSLRRAYNVVQTESSVEENEGDVVVTPSAPSAGTPETSEPVVPPVVTPEVTPPVVPPVVTPDTPVLAEYVITKVDGSAVTTQVVKAGDQTGNITYTQKPDSYFAGWYVDAALTIPANFSNVQSNMVVYPRYVNRMSARPTTIGTISFVNVSVTLPNGDFREVGVKTTFRGETTQYTCTKASSGYYPWNYSSTNKYSTFINVDGIRNMEMFHVTVYWVTADGTTVETVSKVCVNMFGMIL